MRHRLPQRALTAGHDFVVLDRGKVMETGTPSRVFCAEPALLPGCTTIRPGGALRGENLAPPPVFWLAAAAPPQRA